MTPFSSDSYRRNEPQCKGEACAQCGRGVKNFWDHTVRVVDGGARYATEAEYNHEGDIDAGDMYFFPVGSDCAKKLKAAGIYVHEEI